MTRFVIVICFSIAATAASAPALAKAATAEELLEQAISRYQTGQLKESVALLKRAERLTKDPVTQAKIQLYLGFSSCVLGKVPQAETAFKQALTLDPALKLDPAETKKSIIEVFDRVRSSLTGEIEVTADRPGARVSIDGSDKGAAPFKGQLPIGRREIMVATPDGLYRYSRPILINAGRSHLVTAKLEALGGRLQVTSEPPGAKVLIDGKEHGTTPLRDALLAPGSHRVELVLEGYKTTVTSAELRAHQTASLHLKLNPVVTAGAQAAPPAKRKLVWTWVAAGTAVAVAGAGLGLGLWARSGWQDYQLATRNGNIERYNQLHDSVPTRATAANVCFGVAGAAAATAVVLFFFVETPGKQPVAAKAASALLGGWRF